MGFARWFWPSMWRASLNKLWWRLPYDGQGLFSPGDPAMAALRTWSAARFWKRTAWWGQPLLIPVARLAWVLACVSQVCSFAKARTLELGTARELLVDCLRSGARPNEALIWSQFFSSPGQPSGPHPLPGRAAGVLLSRLGSTRERRLLADKQATAELLASAGLASPRLFEIVPGGQEINEAGIHWLRPDLLFVKPRHGSAGRGAMSGAEFLRGGRARAASDDLLVQVRLEPAPELADLATKGAAPVLRLTTAREPEGAAFLHSALVSIDVPGQNARDFLRGQMRVPVNLATGLTGPGIWFAHPEKRYSRLPWNQAQVADRLVPRLSDAIELVVSAMALFPGLPLVNWDLIVTEAGPVILEGNTCGDWILTNLSRALGWDTVPLGTLLCRWARAAEAQAGKCR